MPGLLDQIESENIEATEFGATIGATIWLNEILVLAGRLDLLSRIVARDLENNPMFY